MIASDVGAAGSGLIFETPHQPHPTYSLNPAFPHKEPATNICRVWLHLPDRHSLQTIIKSGPEIGVKS